MESGASRSGMKPIAAVLIVFAELAAQPVQRMALDKLDGLEFRNVKAEAATYQGRKCVRLVDAAPPGMPSAKERLAVVPLAKLRDGAISVRLAARPMAGAGEGARGFVGIAYRLQGENRYEAFYLRPTNGRADDQLRRNHSTQYIAHPEWTWNRLRKEFPGVYESYVDLQPGVWTDVRVTFEGKKARLYVNSSPQPVLIVNDAKMADQEGVVALWIGDGTEAWFADLKIEPLKR
jgi:hypothetical protein